MLSKSGSTLGGFEQLAEPPQGGEHPALDRAEWHTETLRQLGLGQPAVVRQLERLALLGRQLRQCSLDGTPLLAHSSRLVDRLGCARWFGLELVAPAAVLSAHEVDRAAVDERQQPRRGFAARRVVRDSRAPGGQKRL